MAEAILLKSGGGVGSEDVTASRADVLQGKRTVTTDSGDEVAEGTMVDRTIMDSTAVGISPQYPDLPTREGANLQLVADVNGIKRINLQPPIGHYDGNVYINRPASDFGNAAPGDILSGRTATSENGLKMPGTIPDHGIGKKAISSGINGSGLFYYFDPGYYPTDGYTGAWIYQALDQVRAADPNFIAANIKKGVTIFGQTGAFEGLIPGNRDIYFNGTWLQSNAIVARQYNGYGMCFAENDGTYYTCRNRNTSTSSYEQGVMGLQNPVNLTGINKVRIRFTSLYDTNAMRLIINSKLDGDETRYNEVAYGIIQSTVIGNATDIFADVSSLQGNYYISLMHNKLTSKGVVELFRIHEIGLVV